MPHLSKGGKYIFGWSRVAVDGRVIIPDEALREYCLESDEKTILISGSKRSGGFVVAKKDLLARSEISSVIDDNPRLAHFDLQEGETIGYKGRRYCWITIRDNGLVLPSSTLDDFHIQPDDRLLSIRGSNIAFVLALKGPIVEKARQHPEITVF
jgi:hypothetical protein